MTNENFIPMGSKEDRMRLEKTLNFDDANSVLYGIEITEKNSELATEIFDIKSEMQKRPYLKDTNPDTGELKKGGKTEYDVEKENLKKHIKENLTRPSKYVKGAIIKGLIAAGLAADFLNYGPVSDGIVNLSIAISNNIGGDFSNIYDTLTITELGMIVVLFGKSIQSGVRSIIQTMKTKVATNKAFQRMIAMQAMGAKENTAKRIIKVESAATIKSDYYKDREGYAGVENRYSKSGSGEFGINLEDIQKMRKTLDEMNIPRFDRQKYMTKRDKKKYL
ncbi:hypothetical protein A2914_00975 [Candidatus Nomurabacteria bacterium RIFCSPLOWO2_01_FULL_41_21]|uniref:Uncharacterized protein n=2 Tax=Candidatus Nomuraibacteriota TaxID=1752729 RepID=A0A1F6V264_9BACT|nr:MAG: hypothetical protein A2733_02065 [Candidatus Nomurabacteria bacterium RIFCSPHIGHO2_01_FULL_40_20]OGI87887.1 MAG: hypothetical protein A2914_00975 [Candidatus Nomurabacteria bacterium RIFCSPLOWO2_01_FULL_41_21]